VFAFDIRPFALCQVAWPCRSYGLLPTHIGQSSAGVVLACLACFDDMLRLCQRLFRFLTDSSDSTRLELAQMNIYQSSLA
jgi:hypothetical protein